jgi:molecular chaperone IbpA
MTLATLYRTPSVRSSYARRTRPQTPAGAPPYDLAKTGKDHYRLTLEVPGFAAAELELGTEDGQLVVRGQPEPVESQATFLHRGIRRPAFERRFNLAEHVRVEGARLQDGLLTVELAREMPDALRPRTIAIDKTA